MQRNNICEIKKCLVCSTAHMTIQDMHILQERSHKTVDTVFSTEYGFLLLLSHRPGTLKKLKKIGLSKDFRKFVFKMIKDYQITMIEFDRDADTVLGEKVFNW